MDAENTQDIGRLKILAFGGESLLVLNGAMVHVVDDAPVWVTLVPVEETRWEKQHPGYWPRERHFRVVHELRIGTVAELVEDYRVKLTRAFNVCAYGKPEGGPGPIPGAFNLREQNEILARHGHDHFARNDPHLFQVDAHVLGARQDRRSRLQGFTPHQDAVERDVLMRLVAEYHGRRRRRRQNEDAGVPCDPPPTDSPGLVQGLIDALTVLREDRKALDHAAAAAGRAT